MPEGGIRTLVLVEGPSDAAAVGALASRLGLEMGLDTTLHHIQISSAGGITNFSRVLAGFARAAPSARLCGLYDTAVGGEWHVRRALAAAATPIAAHQSPESAGFFACVADLEDELIGALGTQAVERVLEEQGELHSFRRFQAMPKHRGSPVHRQLHRFLGTRATRKIRCAKAACREARPRQVASSVCWPCQPLGGRRPTSWPQRRLAVARAAAMLS